MRYTLNDTAINAYKTYAGSGACTLELQTAARGTTLKWGSGLTRLELQTQAAGTTLKWGSGVTAMELRASAGGSLARSGNGSVALELLVRQGFPDPIPIPGGWSYTHPSRRLTVAPQPTDTLLPDGDRTIRVPWQDRTLVVPFERMD